MLVKVTGRTVQLNDRAMRRRMRWMDGQLAKLIYYTFRISQGEPCPSCQARVSSRVVLCVPWGLQASIAANRVTGDVPLQRTLQMEFL